MNFNKNNELRYLCKRQYQKFRENYDKALILFWEMLPTFNNLGNF